MPMLPDGTWRVDPFVAWRDRVRADVDGRFGVSLDYDGTVEGALTDAQADAVWTLDQGGQALVDGLSPATAASAQLDLIGEAVRIRRRAATRTRYTLRAGLASGATNVTIPAGTVLSFAGAGGETRWTVVEDTLVPADGDPVVVESETAGAVFLPSSGVSVLRVVTPVSGLDDAERHPADGAQLGRSRESAVAYRIRLQRLSSSEGGTTPGWLRRIESVGFVRAASVTITGTLTALVRVVPGTLTAAQQQTLVQAIFDGAPPITYDTTAPSPQTGTAVDPFGGSHVVTWYAGVEEPVDAEARVVLESGYTANDGGPLDVVPALTEAYEALFAALSPGAALRWSDYYCALADVVGVARVLTTDTLTWLGASGGQVDVSPSAATNLLVPGTLTVTT